jgi:glycosyltransferase involved in cell wall biosynthesis
MGGIATEQPDQAIAPEVVHDRDLRGAFLYASGWALTAALAYGFNALLGRRLSSGEFATFGALLGIILALSGSVNALFGGAAMAAARHGSAPSGTWRTAVLGVAAAAALLGSLSIPEVARTASWFVAAIALSLLLAWNRGALVGVGRLGLVGATMVAEGVARIACMLVLVALGWKVVGGMAGLALGIGAAVLLTERLVRDRSRMSATPEPVGLEVRAAIFGLFFLGLIQFADVTAVRLMNGHGAGTYAAASSVARLALYCQLPAAAYALRRSSVAGAARALPTALWLAVLPGLAATVALEVFPAKVISLTYGTRYPEAVGLVRTLAVAMLLSGMAVVLIHLLMGTGRTAWVVSTGLAGATSLIVLFSFASVPEHAAAVMLLAQLSVLVLVGFHVRGPIRSDVSGVGHVVILSWRDVRHPQGGGSEVYVEQVAERLAAKGRPVTIFCAAHSAAPADETVGGVRFIRRGSWRTVYLWAALYHLTGRFGPHEVVIDVQNGIPFFSPMYCGRPVVVLVHHVHEEQWGMFFRPAIARFGWWIESRFSPWLYRTATYVAVSDATKADLARVGVAPERVTVVRNGGRPQDPVPTAPKAPVPTVAYLGRLVPHKRVELVLEAAAALLPEVPDLRVRIIGRGPWEDSLRARANELGLAGTVSFEGFVDEAAKARLLQEAWVLALPSIKEGWGLVVTEAANCRTPTVAFGVGGLREAVVNGRTGLLAHDLAEFAAHLRGLIASEQLRADMGAAAHAYASGFTWDRTAADFAAVIDDVGERVSAAKTDVGAKPVPAI